MALIIGLTGSIASGKTTVSSMFKELHIPVIDADQVARDVVEPGEVTLQKIVEEFGTDILSADGSLNREQLGSIIFKEEEKRKKLNSIIHPAIRKRMLDQKKVLLDNGEDCVVMDIPLLFESKLTHMVDKILVVYVDEHVQLNRLMARDHSSKEQAQSRIQSQIPVKDKIKLADEVINNNGSVEESYKQLREILQKWEIDVE